MGAGQRAAPGHTLTTAPRGSGEAWAFSLGEGAFRHPFHQDCGLHAPPGPQEPHGRVRGDSGAPAMPAAPCSPELAGSPGPGHRPCLGVGAWPPLCPFIAALHPASQPGL